jgi:predicted CXXCH cytochrome family protein
MRMPVGHAGNCRQGPLRWVGIVGCGVGPRSIIAVAASLFAVIAVMMAVMGCPSRVMAGADGDKSDRRCAECHAGIYASWEKTTMARGSGWATDGLIQGSFFHQRSGVNYRVDSKNGEARLRYERDNPAPGDVLKGEERLVYFIGSGRRGRTYLFARPVEGGNLWFESPVNWYGGRSRYDMAPAYENAERAPLELLVEPNCLHCHMTGVAQPLPFARNEWAGAPFRQGGVGCAACHGNTEAHVASRGQKPMLRLETLTPKRQDSVCLQCHLEGDAMIQLRGRSLVNFEPGQDLSDTAVYFVNARSAKSVLRASSQYEALLRSACRRAAGERMTCTTCHDPHSLPAPEERVTYFRTRCLQCHTAPAFDAKGHHPEQQDCASCHMPTRNTADISHEQLTDHNIEARPGARDSTATRTESTRFTDAVDLVPVGEEEAGDRERGLAYAQFAERGDKLSYVRAESLLEKVEFFGQADALVHEDLGYLAQIGGDRTKAEAEDRATLAIDPHDVTALTNLAVLLAQVGNVTESEALLKSVAEHNPSQTVSVLTLAALRCANHDGAGAMEEVRLALRYNPDDAAARRFEETGEYGGVHCRLR